MKNLERCADLEVLENPEMNHADSGGKDIGKGDDRIASGTMDDRDSNIITRR